MKLNQQWNMHLLLYLFTRFGTHCVLLATRARLQFSKPFVSVALLTESSAQVDVSLLINSAAWLLSVETMLSVAEGENKEPARLLLLLATMLSVAEGENKEPAQLLLNVNK
jgi:hypothetical protein